MDKYAKMCDHPLIQGEWVKRDGDWYVAKLNGEWQPPIAHCVECDEIPPDAIWLPSIEQLMELLPHINMYYPLSTMQDMIDFGRQNLTMWGNHKELWLCYIMHELHGMKWDEKGEMWIK